MSKRFFFLFSLLVIAALSLSACQSGGTSGDCSSDDVLCIGVVTDVGEIDDKSFNQSAWEAVQQAEAEYDAQIDFVETQDAKDYEANMQLFVDRNYDVIVTVGFALGEATLNVSTANPDIHFIGVDQFQGSTANYTGILFPEDVSGFLAGALAALMTKTGTVAAVLGTDLVPPVVAFKEGYENGARYINPDINLISTYHPGGLDVAFLDPEWGASTARQALDQGADVVFGAGGKTGNGALIEVASTDGVYCIGVDSDQWETVPEAHNCLISSAMKLITPAVFEVISEYVDGTLQPGLFFGGAGLAPYHDFDSVIPQEVKDQIEAIDADLASGALTTGYTP